MRARCASALAACLVALALLAGGASGGGTGSGEATFPSVSADGRYIAFETGLDLGGPATPGVVNVYVYDRKRGRYELVSRRSRTAGGDGGDGDSRVPAISADGRYVAFWTTAENLGGPVGSAGVYVYDRERKKTELVSRRSRSAGGAGANGSFPFTDVAISANGRHVAFSTDSTNLGGPIGPALTNRVYVYDRRRDKVELASRRSQSAGGQGAGGTSPALSSSGRYVAFASNDEALPGGGGAYVYDRKRDRVELVSRRSKSAGGAPADGAALAPSISASGRHVAFETVATNLGGPINPAAMHNVYVYDRKRDRVQLVSRQSESDGGAGGDQSSTAASAGDGPVLSASGRLVAFTTHADNLGGPQHPGVDNTYLYDRERRRVSLISRRSASAGGQGANGGSEHPAISANGRFVAFDTQAGNLGGPVVPANTRRVFLYDRDRERVKPVIAAP